MSLVRYLKISLIITQFEEEAFNFFKQQYHEIQVTRISHRISIVEKLRMKLLHNI